MHCESLDMLAVFNNEHTPTGTSFVADPCNGASILINYLDLKVNQGYIDFTAESAVGSNWRPGHMFEGELTFRIDRVMPEFQDASSS